jgi:hypothetical protein
MEIQRRRGGNDGRGGCGLGRMNLNVFRVICGSPVILMVIEYQAIVVRERSGQCSCLDAYAVPLDNDPEDRTTTSRRTQGKGYIITRNDAGCH